MDRALQKGKGRRTNPRREVKLLETISARNATSLHIYKENLKAYGYADIVEEHREEMEELYPHEFKYIHDNLKLHFFRR